MALLTASLPWVNSCTVGTSSSKRSTAMLAPSGIEPAAVARAVRAFLKAPPAVAMPMVRLASTRITIDQGVSSSVMLAG
jgi:hypothetical protein